MTARVYMANSVSGSPSYDGRTVRQTQGVLVAINSTARPLGGRTGIAPGTPDSILSVTTTTWTVQPFGGTLDVASSAQAGPYLFAFDANVTGSVNAADSTNQRVDSLFVQLNDPAESVGSGGPSVALNYVAGTPGAAGGSRGSAGGPPAVPSGAMELAQITVPKATTGSPTIAMVAQYTAGASGVVTCRTSAEYPTAPFDGQLVYNRATDQLLVYNGSAWTPYLNADTGWVTTGIATAAAGGSITSQIARKVGNQVQLYLAGTMPINQAGNTSGDYSNTTIATLTSSWQPSHGIGCGAANVGANFTYYIGADGTVQVVSGPPAGYSSGDGFSLSCVYFID